MAKKKSKGIKKQQLGYLAAAFGVLLIGGIVWAATSGVLQIQGNVIRGANVDLDFVSVSCTTNGDLTGTEFANMGFASNSITKETGNNDCVAFLEANNLGQVNSANDLLKFGAFLRTPGDSKTITFSIKNVGTMDTDLKSVATTGTSGFAPTAADGITLGGTYTGLATAQCLAPGVTVGPYTIVVTWPTTGPGATSAEPATFTASMNYEQAAIPCV